MGWSKWFCQFFFLQLLILLPLSLEVEIVEESSCQCPRYQNAYPNLVVDQCYHVIQTSFMQDREKVLSELQAGIKKELIADLRAKVLAELQARIKKELIADLRALIQPTFQHLRKMIDYPPPENDDESRTIEPGPASPANNDDGRHRRTNYGTVSPSVHFGPHVDPD